MIFRSSDTTTVTDSTQSSTQGSGGNIWSRIAAAAYTPPGGEQLASSCEPAVTPLRPLEPLPAFELQRPDFDEEYSTHPGFAPGCRQIRPHIPPEDA